MMFRFHDSLRLIDCNDLEINSTFLRAETDRTVQIIRGFAAEDDVIELKMERGSRVVISILACLELGIAFTFDENNRSAADFKTTCVFDGSKMWRIRESEIRNRNICYVITTSGSTGNAKQVAVPTTCIWPNIEHFGCLFEIGDQDVILFSTSLHFDPSIVELLLAFRFGCQLVIRSDRCRSEPHLLSSAIMRWSVTLVQMTPAVFVTVPDLRRLLDSATSLRIVLMGGSAFPLAKVCENWDVSNLKTRIFDVYGVTEVSCWATVFEVTKSCQKVLLGQPVRGSWIRIDERNMEIVIGGERQCYVNGFLADPSLGHRTGDLVEKCGESGGYRIVGRIDSQIKIGGVRMNLESMSRRIEEDYEIGVGNACFIAFRSRFLVLFVTGGSNREVIEKRVNELFQYEFRPARIEILESFPLIRSGKIDEKALRNHLESIYQPDTFDRLLSERVGINLEDQRNLEKTFVEHGVDSLVAAELSLCFDAQYSGNVMSDLLDPRISIGKFWKRWASKLGRWNFEEKERIVLKVDVGRQPRMKWAHDLRKCIDGNPLVIRNRVFASSHAGIVICIDLESGESIWKIQLPTRFESSPVEIGGDIVLGGYNGFVYRIRSIDGSVQWTFETGSQIKADCAAKRNTDIYCVSYDRNLYKLDANTGGLIWKCSIGGGSPSAPCIINGIILLATITGNVLKIDLQNGGILWTIETGMAIFGMIIVFRREYFLVVGVSGEIQCRTVENGKIESSISLMSPLFCAPTFLNDSIAYVASQNGRIAEIRIDEHRKLEFLRIFDFNCPAISFVRSPKIEKDTKNLLVISTDARFMEIDLSTNYLQKCIEVSNGKVFSIPFIAGKRLICSSRDDWIRCFELEN